MNYSKVRACIPEVHTLLLTPILAYVLTSIWHLSLLSYVIFHQICHMTASTYDSHIICQYGCQKNRMDLRNAGPDFRTIHVFILRYTNWLFSRGPYDSFDTCIVIYDYHMLYISYTSYMTYMAYMTEKAQWPTPYDII